MRIGVVREQERSNGGESEWGSYREREREREKIRHDATDTATYPIPLDELALLDDFHGVERIGR